jgi:hypothetical protein
MSGRFLQSVGFRQVRGDSGLMRLIEELASSAITGHR